MNHPADPEEQAWAEIVANYGERAVLEPSDLADDPPGRPARDPDDDPDATAWNRDLPRELPGGLPDDELRDELLEEDPEEHFVPPPAPPARMPRGPRGIAWLALFGAPVLAAILGLLHVRFPDLLTFGLLVAFLGGFGYLVATMRKDAPDDDWDDGAVL